MIKRLTKQTKTPTKLELKPSWFVIDAKGKVLGRLASQAAQLLMGKGEALQAPGVDQGNHLVVINAKHVTVTGRKEQEKMYYRHSGYPGGLKSATLTSLREGKPERILEQAIKGMLPKSRLGNAIFARLHVFAEADHTYQDRKPEEVKVG